MEITIPKTSVVLKALLKADFTTLWRNRRANLMSLLMPLIIVLTWKGLMPGQFILSNAITLGITAVGLMGYSNSVARDRDKGVFQRLRVSPLPLWSIMASRLIVQLFMILLLTIIVFIAGYQYDHIAMGLSGYLVGLLCSLLGGALYLSLGQAIVGRIQNPETVNSSSRLIYLAFILTGMLAQFPYFGK
jgi:ABC-2 type transport system permease protein